MKDFLNIGLIQPVIDPNLCWNKSKPYSLNIDPISADRVWQEIKTGLRLLLSEKKKPDVILIPELHLPISKIDTLKKISRAAGVMIISGVDFQRNPNAPNKIRNRGIISIPNNWGTAEICTGIKTLEFGKTYFTYMERSMFLNLNGVKCDEDPEKNMYIFTSKEFGNFGIMICSDVFDIERMMMYQGRIHHLFIISLNKDLNTYFSMAETLTRLLYCNVVVCNTGFFGGSVVMSPYESPNDRLIYKYQGQNMFNSHLVTIPVKELEDAQKFDFAFDNKKEKNIRFKASPPGYKKYQ